MTVTDVRIRKLFDDGPMRAIASVTFDGEFAVHDIKVISASGRNFIVMPSRKNPDGTSRDVCHPIVSDFREEIETKVMDAYNTALETAEQTPESVSADEFSE